MTHPAIEHSHGPSVIRLARMTDAPAHGHDAATNISDAPIIARALAGDATAFDQLVRRHYAAAYAVAFAVMANADDAEDICHDAFVHALARIDQCRQPERFSQWIGAIVRNRARNELARPAVRRSTSLDSGVPSSGDSLHRIMERDDLRTTLEAALAGLSEVRREVVLLHDLYDWSHEDIAARIGTSPGMSRQHLFKARRHLRETLGPDLLREYFDD